ncbi:MAG: hypothetical protein J0H85_06160 [Sediminibacterium magnilacihabitans]|jgi:hypothetical protein|nr:hypothetical protein [Sediminibacterium magnilacihabitans]PQV61374.1 hypothetical protein CLV53_103228 [Sediminibacterium magnilacihabitans]
MKRTGFVCLLLLTTSLLNAQKSTNEYVQKIQGIETVIKPYATAIMESEEMPDRFRADSFFTRGLVQALRVPYSFSYPFDSLTTISKLYAPDSSFRIFTWQVMKDYTYYRQKGVIQIHTTDGSLKIFPLFDFSEFTEAPVDSVRSNRNWIGAIYYSIILKEYNHKKYYTLMGYDENDARTTKKWVEVLTFATDGSPQFGGRYFSYPNDALKPPQPAYRFCLEFKKGANAKLNYDRDLDLIIFSHLTSETGETAQKHTLVPEGSYEGFQWISGKWVYKRVVAEVDPSSKVNPPRQ